MKNLLLCSLVLLFQANTFAAEVGVTDTEVVIGAHTSESGTFAQFSANPRALDAYFKSINEAGGIHGRKIKLLRIDTQGIQVKSLQAAKKLVEEDKIFAMVGAMGASHQVVYKYLVEKGVPDLFFSDGLQEYGKPFNKLLFPGIGAFADDGVSLAEIALDKVKGKRACFLVTDSTLGEETYASIKATLEKGNEKLSATEKITFGAVEKIDRLAVNPNAQVNSLKRDNCGMVFNIIWGSLAGGAMNYALLQNFQPTWLTMGQNANPKFLELLNSGNRNGVYALSPIAIDANSPVKGWKAFADMMKKYDIPASKTSATGYTVGELFTEALRIAGKDLTRESVIKAAESLSSYNCSLCMTPVSYTPTNRWGFKNPAKLVSKDGKWTPLQ